MDQLDTSEATLKQIMLRDIEIHEKVLKYQRGIYHRFTFIYIIISMIFGVIVMFVITRPNQKVLNGIDKIIENQYYYILGHQSDSSSKIKTYDYHQK